MIKILMVEDDAIITEFLTKYFTDKEYILTAVIKPSQGLHAIKKEQFDIIILDLTLPEIDGLELCKQLNSLTTTPIIISSARSDINDKLIALEYGADDYLAKPYDPRELEARIKTVLKRTGKIASDENNAFIVNEESSEIFHHNQALVLTPAEYQMLKMFLDNPNRSISRADIANSIDSMRFESGVESINVLIGRIRKKIENDPAKPQLLKTIRGIGYRFAYKI
ncbi:Phosphate regulon transcriptional regulatory protein PhoB (SphR) [hydrothermal vent metagenome]|uniref:Phosphate regulon transcriptional regulatory protein PhoB (SphR) n=1 Tax=hydrothermal vent metagenome TaxID=652676 RepID=A0A1W1CMA2_9ZZZZ